MTKVFRCPPQRVHNLWAMVAPLIASAQPYSCGEYSIDDFRRNCESGEWQLWIGAVTPERPPSVAVSAIITYPQTKLLYILAFAGCLDQPLVNEAWHSLREFARQGGCSGIEAFGRRGWARSGALPKGWRHKSDVIFVPLE